MACKRSSQVFCRTCWKNVSSLQRTRRGTEVELIAVFSVLPGLCKAPAGWHHCTLFQDTPESSRELTSGCAPCFNKHDFSKPCRVWKDVVFMTVRVPRPTSASLV